MVESSIGAVYGLLGDAATWRYLFHLGILEEAAKGVLAAHVSAYSRTVQAANAAYEGRAAMRDCGGAVAAELGPLERRLAYRFRGDMPALRRTGRCALLDCALTHASYCSVDQNLALPSYQARAPRSAPEIAQSSTDVECWVWCEGQVLEFLGDSVLDFLVMRYLFHSRVHASAGRLTDERTYAVRNERLAQVAVQLGLAKYMRHGSRLLFSDITEFSRDVARAAEESAQKHHQASAARTTSLTARIFPYIPVNINISARFLLFPSGSARSGGGPAKGARSRATRLALTPLRRRGGLRLRTRGDLGGRARQVLADLVEAVAGAVLVDSGFDVERVWRVFGPLLAHSDVFRKDAWVELHEQCHKMHREVEFEAVVGANGVKRGRGEDADGEEDEEAEAGDPAVGLELREGLVEAWEEGGEEAEAEAEAEARAVEAADAAAIWEDWRVERERAQHVVRIRVDGQPVAEGTGTRLLLAKRRAAARVLPWSRKLYSEWQAQQALSDVALSRTAHLRS